MSKKIRKLIMEKAEITPCREYAYTIKTAHMIQILKRMEKDFRECCSLQDYLIVVKRWFGEKK